MIVIIITKSECAYGIEFDCARIDTHYLQYFLAALNNQ
ncbi:hypothetical protein PULV_b0141 [Pseudoalteromonas ulvae UL12]|nr:hypothetical protein [Pseudoalteromonas ulvae UL12]